MSEPIRVLHVFSGLRRNGAESRTMDIYRNINREEVQFDFVVHTDKECDYDEEAESMGARIYRVPAYRIINHFSYKKAWHKIFGEHPEYDIIHIHTSNTAAPILEEAVKSNLKVRIVHSRNGHQSGLIKKEYLKLTRKRINELSTHRFAVSQEAGDYVFGNKNYEIWPNAIDAEKYKFDFQIRQERKKELGLENKTVYGHIGRFIEQKNHPFLIDVFESILKKDQNSALVLIGVGDEYDKIEQLVKKKEMEKSVYFLGKREDIPALLDMMDCFIFPSFFEGLPGVVLEAQANGLPCLISDAITKEAAITDLVKYESLSEKPDKWASMAIEMSTRNRKNTMMDFIAAGFDIKSLARKYQLFYKEVERQ